MTNSADPTPQASGSEPSRLAWLTPKFVALVVLLALALVFIFTNLGTVQIQLLIWTVNSPLWALIVGALVVGMIIGWLLPWLRNRKKS